MKYYAVTEDPNELFHYGRLGMKWGQHIFGGEKSLAFQKAAKKLRATKAKAKAAIVKSSAQRDISRVQRQQNRMQKKVMRDQRRAAKIRSINAANKKKEQTRSNLVNAMATLDQEDSFRKEVNQNLKTAQKAQRYDHKMQILSAKRDLIDQNNAIKTMQKSNKAERRLSKYMQQARQGTLKYGNLTDEQVQKIQDRLNMEQRTRSLGSAEKTTKQLRKEALRAGILEGIRKGTSGAMEEVARGIVRNKMANKRVLDTQSRNQAQREKEASRVRNQKSHKDIQNEIKQEAYEAGYRYGDNKDAKKLREIEQKRHEEIRALRSQDKIADQRDEDWNNYLTERGLTDRQAIAAYTGNNDGIGLLNRRNMKKLYDNPDAINATRDKIMRDQKNFEEYQEQAMNEAAYQAHAEQERVKAIEQHNKQEIERYNSERESYEQSKKLNDKMREEYDTAMNDYNEALDAFRNGTRKKRPTKPKRPVYVEERPPRPVNIINSNYNPTSYTLAGYEALKRIGATSSNNNNNNNGGGSGKKNKKKKPNNQ